MRSSNKNSQRLTKKVNGKGGGGGGTATAATQSYSESAVDFVDSRFTTVDLSIPGYPKQSPSYSGGSGQWSRETDGCFYPNEDSNNQMNQDEDEVEIDSFDFTSEEREILYEASLKGGKQEAMNFIFSLRQAIIEDKDSFTKQRVMSSTSSQQSSAHKSTQFHFIFVILTVILKLFFLVILIVFAGFLFSVYHSRSPAPLSDLKSRLLHNVYLSQSTAAEFITTKLYTLSYMQDFPFRFVQYADAPFVDYLKSYIQMEPCDPELDFEFAACCPIKKTPTSTSSSGGGAFIRNDAQQSTDKPSSFSSSSMGDTTAMAAAIPSCNMMNEKLFSEPFIPIIFVHGHGESSDPSQIKFLNKQLHELLIHENDKNLKTRRYTQSEQRKKQKQFRFFALDMRKAFSAFSDIVIERETSALARLIGYIRTRSSERVTLVCHSMGGLVCLNLLASLQDEQLLLHVSQMIFLNAPLSSHPLNSNSIFKNKYNNIYTVLSGKKQLLEKIRFLSFASGSSDTFVRPEDTYLRIPLKSSLHFDLPNIRDVFATVGHYDILSFEPFLNILAKYFVMDAYYKAFSNGESSGGGGNNSDITNVKNFFMRFDMHYEDLIDRSYFGLNKQELDEQCGRVSTSFEKAEVYFLMKNAKRLLIAGPHQRGLNQKHLSEDARALLTRENLLCLRIETSAVKASNLSFFIRTNLPSASAKVFTFKQEGHSASKSRQERKGGQTTIKEIYPEFSFFFASVYLHSQLASHKDVYVVFSPNNDTFLHEEYRKLYNYTQKSEELFLTISNQQLVESSFQNNFKEEWRNSQEFRSLSVPPSNEVQLQRFCTTWSSSLLFRVATMWLSEWALRLSSERSYSSFAQHQHPFGKLNPRWNGVDFNLAILRGDSKNRLSVSFSYSENDCDYLNIQALSRKEILFFRDASFSWSMSPSQELTSQPSSSSSQKMLRQPFLVTEENYFEMLQEFGRSLLPLLVNQHATLSCFLMIFQIKGFDEKRRRDSISQLSFLLNNPVKVSSFVALSAFFNLLNQRSYFEKYLKSQPGFGVTNYSSKEFLASSVTFTCVLTALTLSTFVATQLLFRCAVFVSFLCCSLVKYCLLRVPQIRRGFMEFAHFKYSNMLSALLFALTVSSFHAKWGVLFLAFWANLGYMQTVPKTYAHVNNLTMGFAYLAFIYIVINAHPFLALAQRYVGQAVAASNAAQTQQPHQNLAFVEEFLSEFITIGLWMFILLKVDNLVHLLKDPMQILFLIFSLFLAFFTFLPLAFTNDFIKNLTYLLAFFAAYTYNQKTTVPV